MRYEAILVENRADGVARLTLNRPNTRNALDDGMIGELLHALRELRRAPRLRALVLDGRGPVFCAGGRVQWLQGIKRREREKNHKQIGGLVRLLTELNEFPAPTICAIRGAAIGGGVGLVSVTDAAVCSAEVVFSLSEARLGLVPSCICPFVLARIGVSWTRRYMMTGERFTAASALQTGLVHEVVARPGDLEDAVGRFIASIMQCAPGATRTIREMIHAFGWPERRAAMGDWRKHAVSWFAASRVSEEGVEGLRAFLEKRPPQWQVKSGGRDGKEWA